MLESVLIVRRDLEPERRGRLSGGRSRRRLPSRGSAGLPSRRIADVRDLRSGHAFCVPAPNVLLLLRGKAAAGAERPALRLCSAPSRSADYEEFVRPIRTRAAALDVATIHFGTAHPPASRDGRRRRCRSASRWRIPLEPGLASADPISWAGEPRPRCCRPWGVSRRAAVDVLVGSGGRPGTS